MITIENRRFALMVAVGVILFLLWQAWQKDFNSKQQPVATAPADVPMPVLSDEVPSVAKHAETPKADAPNVVVASPTVQVETDVMRVSISTLGGDLRHVELKGYPVAKQLPNQDVALLDDKVDRWFVIQSGLAGTGAAVVSHKDVYSAASDRYVLADGSDLVEIPLQFTGANGLSVTKTYRFKRGSYVVELAQTLRSGVAQQTVSPYVQLWRIPFSDFDAPPFTPTFMGLGFYEQKSGNNSYRFNKVSFDDLAEEPVELKQTGGWLAMLQHYFFAAVIPPAGEALTFYGKPSTARGYLAQYIGAAQEVPAQTEKTFNSQLYIGPKLQQTLADIAPGLELTIDYGILTPLAEPLFWLLNWFHKLTGNWGAAIILLTLAVKLVMYKLSEAQYRGMAKMKKYAPRIQEMKERYGDDRERMQKAMMEMYKKEKFNPLAGCWPLLVQMPIFIALYWVLLESVELRQADFMLWLNDLSAPDPYYIMPVLFGISMFVQQKLSGTTMTDPMQQRMMNIMPVMLTVFFAFFPVGLVLYWFVSNLIGIAQQWYITRKLEKEGAAQRA